jgi:hypothetical protein
MPRKAKKGGYEIPTMPEIVDLSNIKPKEYKDFDISKNIEQIKISHFAGGSIKKKMSKILKNLYLDYRNKKKSKLQSMIKKKMQGGQENDTFFPYSISSMYNTSTMNYSTPYKYDEINRLSSVPYSHLAL